MPRVVASIEARMQSTRLPGKVLLDVAGVPALTRLLRRLQRSQTLNDIVVATTVQPADDAIAALAAREGVACYRGSEHDVLQRVLEAQQHMQSDIVVEITGDSILTDPMIIDLGVETFLANSCDVVTNVRPPTFPMGVDVQVFRTTDLAYVARHVSDPAAREHVSLYFYEHPERYRVLSLLAPARWRGPELRFQLDYPEDHAFLTQVYRRLEPQHGEGFGIEEVMQLIRRHPELTTLNAHCEEKAVR